ncbi:MAG: cupin domain-containing protein [Armatimonadota bacterium]
MTTDRFCALLREMPQDEERIMGALACHRDLRCGQHFNVPAPTMHALGPGLLTVEISERSQITYRLFDYNRERSRGKLDIAEGCEALLHPMALPPPL